MNLIRITLASIAIICFISTGCEYESTSDGGGSKTGVTDDGHGGDDHGDEGHEHVETHGEHGGHMLKFDSDEYQGEWLHYTDNDIIRLIILESDGKTKAPVKADSITITRKADGTPFQLDPEEADEEGKTAVYSLDNKDLAIAITTGVTVEMKLGEKTYTAEIKPHKAHKH